MNYLLGALLWLDPHCSRPGKNARWFHFDQWHIGDPPGHDRSSFFFPHSIALNTYPARETTNRGFREDVHRILFPCSLFFLFFFFVFSAIEPFFYPRLLDSRDKQSTLSSYRDLLFPCAKRGKETWLLVVYARHTLDQILSANFVTVDIDSTMDLWNHRLTHSLVRKLFSHRCIFYHCLAIRIEQKQW